MTQLKTRRWQEMLTPEQQEKYANAIRQGYFATYDGYPWRHTFYGAWIWKHPGRVKVVNIFKGIVGRPPRRQPTRLPRGDSVIIRAKLSEDHLRRSQRHHTRKLLQARPVTQFRDSPAHKESPVAVRSAHRRRDTAHPRVHATHQSSQARQAHLHARMPVRSTPLRLPHTLAGQHQRGRTHHHIRLAQDQDRRQGPHTSVAAHLSATNLPHRAERNLRKVLQRQHTRHLPGMRNRNHHQGLPRRTHAERTQVGVRLLTHRSPLLRHQPRAQRHPHRTDSPLHGTHVRQRPQHLHDAALHRRRNRTLTRDIRSLPDTRSRTRRTRNERPPCGRKRLSRRPVKTPPKTCEKCDRINRIIRRIFRRIFIVVTH